MGDEGDENKRIKRESKYPRTSMSVMAWRLCPNVTRLGGRIWAFLSERPGTLDGSAASDYCLNGRTDKGAHGEQVGGKVPLFLPASRA